MIHDQSIVNDETRLAGELGLASWLAAGLMVPLRVFQTSIRYVDPATGQPVQIENPYIHHHDETLVGPGDPWLVARAATRAWGLMVSARLGVTLPLGRTEPDPFVLGDMGIAHEHTQFGTGTFAPIAGIEAARAVRGVSLDAYALTVQSLYANGDGYRAGNRYALGLGAASALGTKAWRFRVTLERMSETAERWHGVIHEDEGNIGRVDGLAGIEASYALDDDWRAALAVKLPFYTHVEGGQVDVPAYVGVTVSTHLHLWEPRRPPVAQPHSDWSGLDKVAISSDGRAVPLAPVAGKLTVFDFWADWCVPCGELDHRLSEVVRRHPDDLAVRTINIVDIDLPAAQQYLVPGGFNLPHIKLYGRDGKLRWERSASPAALAAAVEDALGPAPVAGPSHAPGERIAIAVTDAGYAPARVEIPRGKPVVLVFTRTSETTCAVDVHLTLPDGAKLDRALPLRQPVEIPLRVDHAAEIPFACGMAMVKGTIVVK